ncbi:cellulose-binding domain-containing protein, partial [Micromonospora sp. KC723]|uniref:cellulose-binding domain-containing protein n=1 Tax=Micromonospora sp. KC723 TaxID=2530381 RepID=UPI0010E07480
MKRVPIRRALVALLATTVVAAGGAFVAASAQAAAVGCRVTWKVTSQWNTGFGADVAVTNLGEPLDGWTLRWTFPAGQTVTQAWNATVDQSGSAVTATNAAHNRAVGTGATVSFGFNGTWTGSNPTPASFTVNGTTCTGGTASPPPTPT